VDMNTELPMKYILISYKEARISSILENRVLEVHHVRLTRMEIGRNIIEEKPTALQRPIQIRPPVQLLTYP
jgi:hypothetical protein